MTNADKMFEELGYTKHECKGFITYTKDYGTHKAKIEFEIDKQYINTIQIFNEKVEGKTFGQCWNAKKLQAINEKCKELGWLE